MSTPQTQQLPFTGTTPGQSLTQVLEMWEPFVHQALDAQTAAFTSWVDGMAATPNVPEPFKGQLLQMQELSRGWTASQRQMWDALFAVLRQMVSAGQSAPQAAMGSMPGLDMWQKMVAPIFEAQAAWMRQSASLVSGPATSRKGEARHDK